MNLNSSFQVLIQYVHGELILLDVLKIEQKKMVLNLYSKKELTGMFKNINLKNTVV